MTRFFIAVITSLFLVTSAFAADVDGEWSVMFNAAEGGTTVPMTITVDGEDAKAMAGTDELTGTYKDGKLTLEGPMYVPEAGMTSTLNMDATIDGDKMTGTATWDMYSADVIGTRK